MELKYRLLDHPFYKSWSDGNITKEQLSKYGASYAEFINKIPDYWRKIVSEFVPHSITGMTVINEEKSHIHMWDCWNSLLEPVNEIPKIDDVLSQFELMNTSELLGALHSFEIQQPAVAASKKNGLLHFYGFNEKELIYFDEHLNEDDHINFGKMLSENYADKTDFKNGFENGSEILYNMLDRFAEC